MKKKVIIIILIITIISTFSNQLATADLPTIYTVYTITHVEDIFNEIECNTFFEEENKITTNNLSTKELAELVFSDYFDEEICKSSYLPKGAKFLNIFLDDKHLFVNVSDDILKYGGNFYENNLRAELIKNALEIDGVDYFTLLIEGETRFLTEGSEISYENEVPEIF